LANSSPLKRILLCAALLAATALFTALGVWQLERRAWKMDLIDRVDARIHADAAPAPPPSDWAGLSKAKDEYLRVSIRGTYLNNLETEVEASTADGMGYWVLTPFKSDAGFIVLINRGFVPHASRDPRTREAGQRQGEMNVTGLLRMTEPRGQLWRSNEPPSERWYSRDVAAIVAHRGLSDAAPYFIDADSTPNPGGLPIGGLTVIAFPNNHLVYAITWCGLAILSLGFLIFGGVGSFGRRLRLD